MQNTHNLIHVPGKKKKRAEENKKGHYQINNRIKNPKTEDHQPSSCKDH